MQVKEADGETVQLSIMSSAQAAIGYYDVIVETKSKDSSGEESLHRYRHEEQICILFNAWCKGNFLIQSIDLVHNHVKQCFCGSNVHCGSCSHVRIQRGVVFHSKREF